MSSQIVDGTSVKTATAFNRSAIQMYLITLLFYSVIYMMMVILPIHLKQLNLNNIDIGFIMGITMIATMLCRPIAGKWIDAFSPYRVALRTLAIFPIILLLFFIPQLMILSTMRVFIGVASALFSSAISMMIIDQLDDTVRGQGVSLYSLASVLPTTFGPALAFSLVDVMSIEQLFMGFVLISLMNLGLMKKLLNKNVASKIDFKNRAKTDRLIRNFKDPNISFVWKNPLFISSSSTILLASVAHGAIFTFLPLYLMEIEIPEARTYFLVQMTVLVLARFTCSQFIDKHLIKYSKVIVLGLCALTALGTFLITQSNHLMVLLSAAVLNGVAFSSLYPLIATKLSFNLPKPSLGFWMSIFIGAADLGFALGAILMGYVIEHSSYTFMFQLCSFFSILGGFIYMLNRACAKINAKI